MFSSLFNSVVRQWVRGVIALIFICISTTSLARSSSAPPPTIFDYFDDADEIVTGEVSSVETVVLPGSDQRVTTVIELTSAQYIDGDGVHSLQGPIYLYAAREVYDAPIGSALLYATKFVDDEHTPLVQFQIQDDGAVFLHTEWDGSGIIQHIDTSNRIVFRTPYHSCTVKSPAFRVKEYECQYLDETITVRNPPDTAPPIQADELIEVIVKQLAGSKFTSSDRLRSLALRIPSDKLIEKYLKQAEVLDKVYTELLDSVPLSEQRLDQLNQRERARGNDVFLKNDPKLVIHFEKLEAEQAATDKRKEEEYQRNQAASEALQKQQRAKEIALEGDPIPLNRDDASMSIDAQLLPGCTQLVNSPDFPIEGGGHYIGNCKDVESGSVCTLKTDAENTTMDCVASSEYLGGVITPIGLPFDPATVPWAEEEIVILFYGAGMSTSRQSALRQPPNAPKLFDGIQPTIWNQFLRQVESIPESVPVEFQ